MRMMILVFFVAALGCGAPAEADETLPPMPRTTMTLAEAVARGVVKVEARGGGTRAVALVLEARADVDLVVPAGTFFRAKSDAQNMVVVATTTARLDRGAARELVVETACASYGKRVPYATDGFALAPADPKLHALVTCLERTSPDVGDGQRQLLVWSVTDGVRRDEAVERRDVMRPYLVDACVRKLRRSHERCTKLVDIAYDKVLEKWLEPKRDDGSRCLPSG